MISMNIPLNEVPQTTSENVVDRIALGIRECSTSQYLLFCYKLKTARQLLDEVWAQISDDTTLELKNNRVIRTESGGKQRVVLEAAGAGHSICGMRYDGIALERELAQGWQEMFKRRGCTDGHWISPIDSRLRQDGWLMFIGER